MNVLVAKISEQKAKELEGKEFVFGGKFHPTQDNEGNWFVSFMEAQYLSVGDFEPMVFIPKEDDEVIKEVE